MAKNLIKNTQELMDRAHKYGINTDELSIEQIGQEVIDHLMLGYDKYYMYIDNAKQMREAEQCNNEIDAEVASIRKVVAEFNAAADATLTLMDEETTKEEEIMNNKTMSVEEMIDVLEAVMKRYDWYTDYIDNAKQCAQAEKRNEEIVAEFIQLFLDLTKVQIYKGDFHAAGYRIRYDGTRAAVVELLQKTGVLATTDKAEVSTEDNQVSVNETTNTDNKEETIMKNNTLTARILNMNRIERLVYVRDVVLNVTKTSDELYIDKAELAQFLFDNDIISRCIGKNELKRTKRDELVNILVTTVDNLIAAGVIIPVKEASVSVGDLEITRDNAPAQVDTTPAPANKNDAKTKTQKLLALLKKRASENESKGYGFTISSFMLQATILEAGTGLTQFKGHKVTEEESKMANDVYAWLKKNGYIKPVIYSVKEDEHVRVYTSEYTGRTTSEKTKLIPYAKSAGYTAKQCTSFLVTFPQA